MSETIRKSTSRREFLKNTGQIAATSALVAGIIPRIYAGQNNTINLALVGCGGWALLLHGLLLSMRFSAYQDGASDEHDEAPELVVAEAQMEGAVDQLIEDEAHPGAGQGEAHDTVVVAFPGHYIAPAGLLRPSALPNDVGGRARNDVVISSP